ncbi:hypothetical protein PHYC_03832 [Phycisphaerales bacterium]|nr:hypothetical protein PHYC_03832 [Phycisphaerales bacterium]
MGPCIILDKSAVESISDEALVVQSVNFYTVITPVLVWEVCGDIQKAREGKCDINKTRSLAQKVRPFHSIVTADWRRLCVEEMNGARVELGTGGLRRPVVVGAHSVPMDRGGTFALIEDQPESRALMRWGFGKWNDEDENYSRLWRHRTKSLDLEGFKRRLKWAQQKWSSAAEAKPILEKMVSDPSLQFFLIERLISDLGISYAAQVVMRRRWSGEKVKEWRLRCPYSSYCAKTLLGFHLALAGDLIGTRSTNRVDLEYLFYLPFAPIFVSGDKCHQTLALILMASDQRFVPAEAFRSALQEVADASRTPEDTRPSRFVVPPKSLIRDLWQSAFSKDPPPWPREPAQGVHPKDAISAAQLQELIREVEMKVRGDRQRYPERPPWPSA